MMQITPTVKQLLIINVIFFAGTQFVGESAYQILSLYFPENPTFEFWQPLTHMFMHGNLMHILFNMFALYSFGSALEHFWGGKKFLFFYISCGLGAALLHTAVNYFQFHQGLDALVQNGFSESEVIQVLNGKNNQQLIGLINSPEYGNFVGAYFGNAVGASGAVYGLLVAFAFMMPNAELALMFVPIPIKAKYFVPGLLLIDLFLGVSGKSIFGGSSGIAHFAHIGGAIIGFLMMWYWKKDEASNSRWN